VSAANSSCESGRVPAVVSYDPPAAPVVANITRCGTGLATFTVDIPFGSPAIREVRLFDATGAFLRASDNTAPYELTVQLSTATTYLVRTIAQTGTCESQSVTVVGNVDAALNPPTATPDNVAQCGNGSVAVTVGLPPNTTLRVYDAPIGGNLVSSFGPGTSVIDLTPGTYFLASTSSTGACESNARKIVTISVRPTPDRPTVANISFCGASRVSFSPTFGLVPGDRINLYDSPTAVIPVAVSTTAPFVVTTPNAITQPTTFYIASGNANCESSRIAVVAAPTSTLPAPMVSNSTLNLCGPGEAVIMTMPGAQVDQVRLYTSLVGGSPIRVVSAPFEIRTPVVTNSGTTFYVESVAGSCISTRTPVVVNVSGASAISAPSAIAASRCGAGPVTIAAFMGPNPGTEIRLYDSPTSQTPVTADNTAPYELNASVSASTTWYVAALSGQGCESQRSPVAVTVTPAPAGPNVSSVSRCGSGPATFSVINPMQGVEYRLYQNITDQQAITATSSQPYTLTANAAFTTNFFVSAISGVCEGPRNAVTATVTPGPTIVIDNLQGEQCLSRGSFVARAIGGSGNYTYTLSNGQTNNSGVFTNLTGGNYTVTVRDNANSCNVSQFATVTSAAGPATVSVSNINVPQATVNWAPVNGAQSYVLRYGINGQFTTVPNISGAQTATIINVAANQNYEVQVAAVCSGGSQTSFTSTTFNTALTVGQGCSAQRSGICQTPINLNAQQVNANAVAFTWTPNEDASGSAVCYLVSYGPVGTNPSSWPQQSIPHPGCTFQATGLIPSQTYTFRVRTNCSNCSQQSGILTPFTTINFTPAAPKDAVTQEVANFAVRVYPNPTTGLFTLTVDAPQAGAASVTLVDVAGRTVHTRDLNVFEGKNELPMDLTGNTAGIYLLKFSQGSFTEHVRLIVK
jgi:hypothetical protein